ncbi:glycoside hydrolase family 3 N-terminal domain-containing protein [Microtetraspora sp. NBRC 16547]|uniref:glycoside hydrolase family 3 protein n=1 Tax=Microtetraspora sp. NBRC 16547 TaxID=3030993 RepID=UPI0024A027FC|nr:glycoside hydrolase family 3 N-terminal domain-containing protein [Microtetraspora sp. NBRC 16547]GLW98051.1 hydrolase [Microtetraspora sp. NBRC 16547]
MRDLLRLADTVILPGFPGTAPPDWLRGRLADGLAGVVLFSRNVESPGQLADLTAALRAENPHVLVGIDEEAGDVTRLEARTGSSRPGNYALGVVDDEELTEQVARDVGRDLAAAGVNLDFAPAADVNSNPDNPVIGLRAFGADPELVARHTAAWIRGLQSAGVAACAKHFPGHGDTAVDSHHGVPQVTVSREELAEVELWPFRAAIREGVRSIMTGHLLVTAYDDGLPATLSPRILTGLLRKELGFDGLIVTDGIEMAAVSGPYGLGGASAMAVAAGADAVCVGGENSDEEALEHIRRAIVAAVVEGRLPEERLADAARRVRELASWHAAQQAGQTGEAGKAGRSGQAGRSGGQAAGSPGANGSGPGTPVGIGLVAARRAIRVTTRAGAAVVLPLAESPHVVELAPETNLAIDKNMPWGAAEPLGRMLPGTTVTRLRESDVADGVPPAALGRAAGRPLVVVVRDAHRHPWQLDTLSHLLSARPDGVVVEMGLPGRTDLGAVHIATHGAARVCGQAAAEVLIGRV